MFLRSNPNVRTVCACSQLSSISNMLEGLIKTITMWKIIVKVQVLQHKNKGGGVSQCMPSLPWRAKLEHKFKYRKGKDISTCS
jgi:hypothetical protein